MGESLKYDDNKLRLELLPDTALAAAAVAFGYGAEKYAPDNWRRDNGIEWNRVYGSLQRHLHAWHSGQDVDPESCNHHLAHALAQLMILTTYVYDGIGTDDRFRKEGKHDI